MQIAAQVALMRKTIRLKLSFAGGFGQGPSPLRRIQAEPIALAPDSKGPYEFQKMEKTNCSLDGKFILHHKNCKKYW